MITTKRFKAPEYCWSNFIWKVYADGLVARYLGNPIEFFSRKSALAYADNINGVMTSKGVRRTR